MIEEVFDFTHLSFYANLLLFSKNKYVKHALAQMKLPNIQTINSPINTKICIFKSCPDTEINKSRNLRLILDYIWVYLYRII